MGNAALFGGKHSEGFLAAFAKEQEKEEDFKLDDDTLMSLLNLGVDAKMTICKIDPKERHDGMIFGMLSSSYAAEKLGIMTAEDRKIHDDLCWKLLRKWPLPEPKPTIERVMALAMKDSKRGITGEAEDEISDVLLRKLGDVVTTKTQNLSKFPCQLIHKWLADMGFPA